MMKCWQTFCNAPLKSFWIELLAVDFIGKWNHAGKSTLYYDWMVRDFLGYLAGLSSFASVMVPGTHEIIWIGDKWKSRAETAYSHAKVAVEHEAKERPYSAGEEWQKLFGTYIPIG